MTNLSLQQIDFRARLMEAFNDFLREAIATTPQLLAALILLAVFVVATFVARRTARATLMRVGIPIRIRLLITRFVFIVGLTLGIIISLAAATGASLGQVIAGFGLLSLGVGFALKNIIENLISGILTILTAPFHIGDEIEVGGYEGTVEAITIQDTILRTFDGKKVSVPNRDVYINTVVNQTAYKERRYDVTVGVHYEDDIGKVQQVALETLASIPQVRTTPRPLILVSQLGDYAVNLTLRFWADPRQRDETQVTSTVSRAIKEALTSAGITIPYPIQTLHIPDGSRPLQQDS